MVDLGIGITLILFAIKGFWAGDTKELIGIAAFFCMVPLALVTAPSIAEDIVSAGFTPRLAMASATVISTLITYPLAYLCINFITKEVNYFSKRIPISKRVLGGGFSFLKGLFMMVLLVSVLARTPIKSGLIERSHLIPYLTLYPLQESDTPTP